MIELYGTPTPSAFTVAAMLEETQCAYSVFSVNKNKDEKFELEFLKTTQKNSFPVILDREGPQNKPFVVFETGAILLYLAEKTNQLLPKDATEKFEVLQWLLFENSKIAPILGNAKHFMYHAPEEIPYALKRFNTEAKRVFSTVNNQLADNDYLAGELSIADVAAYPWLKEYERFGLNAEQIPYIADWLNRLADRPSIKKSAEIIDSLKD